MTIEEIKQCKCVDIVCDTPGQNKSVVDALINSGYTVTGKREHEPTQMIRCFGDGEYMQHYKEWAGSIRDSVVITASQFITSNSQTV